MKRDDKKDFTDLRRALDESRKEQREGRPRSERRAEARRRNIPKDRVCPRCKCLKPNTRQWVALSATAAICLSCFREVKQK